MIGITFLFVALVSTAAHAAPVSFDEALERVRARSVGVRRAEEQLGIARERVEAARGAYYPALSATAKLMRGGDTVAGYAERARSVGAEAGINLYRFGG